MDERAQLTGMHFGIEIETVNLCRKDTVEAIRNVIGGTVEREGGSYDKWCCTAPDGRQWKAVSDASIGRSNAEVVSPILTYPDDVPVLQNIVRWVKKRPFPGLPVTARRKRSEKKSRRRTTLPHSVVQYHRREASYRSCSGWEREFQACYEHREKI